MWTQDVKSVISPCYDELYIILCQAADFTLFNISCYVPEMTGRDLLKYYNLPVLTESAWIEVSGGRGTGSNQHKLTTDLNTCFTTLT